MFAKRVAMGLSVVWCVSVLFLAGCGGQKTYKDTVKKTLHKAVQLEQKGEREKALELYNSVVEKHPDDKQGFMYRAMFYANNKQNDKALTDYLKVMELDPEEFYCAQQIAYLAREKGDKAMAKKYDTIAMENQQKQMEKNRDYIEQEKAKKSSKKRK
ncbi:MAG: hypothetical protein Q4D98_01750 [Planctomycetia bacterium]|nr:hypothetical protein [Planctomycetia bacterium]